jgi:hypothetical protein
MKFFELSEPHNVSTLRLDNAGEKLSDEIIECFELKAYERYQELLKQSL